MTGVLLRRGKLDTDIRGHHVKTWIHTDTEERLLVEMEIECSYAGTTEARQGEGAILLWGFRGSMTLPSP